MKIVALEGISGAGKSFYYQMLKDYFKEWKQVCFLDELGEGTADDNWIESRMSEEIALLKNKNRFLSTGYPVEESVLIAANYIIKIEQVRKNKDNVVLVTDRGSESIAVYQAILLDEAYYDQNKEAIISLDKYQRINDVFTATRSIADSIIFLQGDTEKQVQRAENRNGNDYTAEERKLLYMANNLFKQRSVNDRRYLPVFIDNPIDKNLSIMVEVIQEAATV